MRRALLTTTTNTYASLGLLVLRVGMGILMLTHGYPKLMKLLNGNLQFGDPLGIGSELSLVLTVFAEFLCALLIIIGAYTRLAAIPLIIGMSTAAFIVHSSDPFGTKEKAIMYLVVFVTLFITGSGKYSLDRR